MRYPHPISTLVPPIVHPLPPSPPPPLLITATTPHLTTTPYFLPMPVPNPFPIPPLILLSTAKFLNHHIYLPHLATHPSFTPTTVLLTAHLLANHHPAVHNLPPSIVNLPCFPRLPAPCLYPTIALAIGVVALLPATCLPTTPTANPPTAYQSHLNPFASLLVQWCLLLYHSLACLHSHPYPTIFVSCSLSLPPRLLNFSNLYTAKHVRYDGVVSSHARCIPHVS